MNYIFPIAQAINHYSSAIVLIVFGILGHNVIAAGIALVHAASFVLFYSFSAIRSIEE